VQIIQVRIFGSNCTEENLPSEIREAITSVVWPEGNHVFSINPTRKGNGVRPIKNNFMHHLVASNYSTAERTNPSRYDAYNFSNQTGVEWETGNISSSHRAINRIISSMINDETDVGILVLPSRVLYNFLTDRIGNFREMEVYFPMYDEFFEHLPSLSDKCLYIVSIQHDSENGEVPLIPKGSDGMSELSDSYRS
jgi:hypothetical protein